MATFQTYQAVGNREDLLNIIVRISPEKTLMLSGFKKSRAKGTLHEWLQDSLAAAATNAKVEGADADIGTVTPRVRVNNYCQISDKAYQISETQKVTLKAGVKDEVAYQREKHMKELARDMELALHDGSGNSGASGTARELKGVRSFITTNVETGSGTGNEILTEDMFNDMLQTIFDAGGDPDFVYVNGFQKRKIAGFASNDGANTRNIAASDKRLIADVNIYESPMGFLLRMMIDRFATASEVLILEKDKWKVATLRPIKISPLSKTGDSEKEQIVAEYTLEALHEAASGKIIELTA